MFPGVVYGLAGGIFVKVLADAGGIESLYGVTPVDLARFGALVIAAVYVFEPEVKKRFGTKEE